MNAEVKWPVAEVGGSIVYGTKLEAIAARLNSGDKIKVNGQVEIVDYVWFYEAPIIHTTSGLVIHLDCGDLFEPVIPIDLG